MKQGSFLFLILILLPWMTLGADRASATEVFPFYLQNQNPLVRVYGLPAAEGGRLTAPGRVKARLVVNAANSFSADGNTREEILLDGETYRTTLSLRYGIGKRLEAGLDLPYVAHEGGVFDGFIDWWHDVGGFSGGGRGDAENDRLAYVYARDGRIQAEVSDPTGGIGDVSLSCGLGLLPGPRALSLRVGLELPTGDAESLRGSESTDLSLRLAYSDDASLEGWDLSWFGHIGVLWMSGGEVLADRQRELAGFGGLGVGWAPLAWLALKGQIDAHTPIYRNSRFRELEPGFLAAQLVLGGTLELPGATLLDLGVSEDIVVDSAPDVVFHAALRRRF